MESLIMAVVVGVTVWLFMRRIRLKRLQQAQAKAAPRPEPKTMPRVGTPGTINKAQMAQLKKLHFMPDRGWSEEEAALIIDTVMYLRAAIEDTTGETDAPLEIQNQVLGFILTDEALRDYLLSWGQNRARRGETDDKPVLRQNENYDRVVDYIRSLRDDG